MLPTDLKSPLPAAPIATEAHPFERELYRHDWILIPLLFLISTVVLAASVELTARKVFSESQKTLASCMILKDPATGPRGVPNTVCKEKNAEANWIETRFDRCGYRNDIQCGPKPPGTYRIVMTGSSTALGERVQREESFASLLPAELSAKTGLKVELYNESMNFGFPISASLRFNDIFAQQPDLVLWTLTPIDIQSAALALPSEEVQSWNNQDFATKLKKRILNNLDSQPLLPALAAILGRTRTGLVLRHFMYLSHSQYLKSYYETSDEEHGFLKSDPSKRWRGHLVDFETTLVKLADKSKAAGVPFVVSLIPNRAQTAMIAEGTWPPGYDPPQTRLPAAADR